MPFIKHNERDIIEHIGILAECKIELLRCGNHEIGANERFGVNQCRSTGPVKRCDGDAERDECPRQYTLYLRGEGAERRYVNRAFPISERSENAQFGDP